MRILVTGGSGFIGTHFIELVRRERPDAAILNIDLASPKLVSHQPFWAPADIVDSRRLQEIFAEFGPTHVVHMAARIDVDGTTLDDYRVNVDGSASVIEAINCTPGIERVIFVSTQYVVGPGALPSNVHDLRPHTVYGESKSVMEAMIHEAALTPCWTIVRPTNVWGSWHPRYAKEFWLVLKQGRYVHPGGAPVRRAYGYVGNVVEQMWAVFGRDVEQVSGQTFYLGDEIDDIKKWVTAFSLELTGKEPRVVPRPVLRAIALVGDGVIWLGRKFPLFSSRYRSMTQEYLVDMTPTFQALGPPRYSLEEGTRITVEWLKTQGEIWR